MEYKNNNTEELLLSDSLPVFESNFYNTEDYNSLNQLSKTKSTIFLYNYF
jgi:hypothetical protein